ncbi:hypothetical protein GIW81_15235 [Hyphomicrobium sp. xq]|uniref:Uncharacterized protein n=1 Tax=Hyphomicrobium album TaxID=2665159 RepID=A0A6I3KPG8_9HYPH|nr:hypothetical protein [Hyphomicrobium album]MTD95692.1 hypothetical protein [Hyphomicrobium album]
MQIAANAKAITRRDAQDEASYQFAGLLIVSLFPALFWTALIAGIGAAVGHSPSAVSLMTIGTAIAIFCAGVGQMLFSQKS